MFKVWEPFTPRKIFEHETAKLQSRFWSDSKTQKVNIIYTPEIL